MGRIHLLEDDVINKIAAGEVVERPASVVKELVENALDAGSKKIEVSLELGGTRNLVVTDDGSGMSGEDAVLAVTRHATSKIRSAADLVTLSSMGFRGEALASIAAVSRFSLATTEAGQSCGVKLTIAGGEPVQTQPWSGPSGTTIAVENLFYNLPVRAKFLKAPATELSHCLELVQAFALCHPSVAFTLKHNGREVFHVTAETNGGVDLPSEPALRARAKSVLGKDAAALLFVNHASRHGNFVALVSPPGIERATGRNLVTFVNGRWVKDRTMRYGILRGYHSHLLKGRFPVVIAHLQLDPSLVDVNVHPAKTEVRFQYPDEVQHLLALGIRDHLRQATWADAPAEAAPVELELAPSVTSRLEPLREGAYTASPLARTRTAPTPWSPSLAQGGGRVEAAPRRASSLSGFAAQGGSTSSMRSFGAATGAAVPDHPFVGVQITDKASLDRLLAGSGEASATGDERAAAGIPWDELQYLGAFDRCYLLFETAGRLLAVDQHAFHERVLFERLVNDGQALKLSQPLLVPEAVELSPVRLARLLAVQAPLAERGFVYQREGATTLLVRAVPQILVGRDLSELFSDLGATPEEAAFDELGREPADSNVELARLILATTACHAAVRAGEELPPNELKQLLAEARTVDFYHNCPHGRRVFRWWSRSQVAHWFDR